MFLCWWYCKYLRKKKLANPTPGPCVLRSGSGSTPTGHKPCATLLNLWCPTKNVGCPTKFMGCPIKFKGCPTKLWGLI